MPPDEAPTSEAELLLIRLGESGPGFPSAEEAVRILADQTATSPHKLALLPTRVKPAARAENGPVLLESGGQALAEAVIVKVEARSGFGPEMKEQWAKAGLTDVKSWVIIKSFKTIGKPLQEVARTSDGKALDRTVGNRQFRWMTRLAPGERAPDSMMTPVARATKKRAAPSEESPAEAPAEQAAAPASEPASSSEPSKE